MLQRTFFPALALSIAAFSSSTQAAQGLLKVASVYIDKVTGQRAHYTGSAFTVAAIDEAGATRIFAVTASHLTQADESYLYALGSDIPCTTMHRLAENNTDLEIIELKDCVEQATFDYLPGSGFFAKLNSAELPKGFVGRTNGQDIASNHIVIAQGVPLIFSTYKTWYNVIGDHVSNVLIIPGQSGSPFVDALEEPIKVGDKKYNTKLSGIIKGSWRFFGLSKAANVNHLQELVNMFLQRARGQLSDVNWVVRSGYLTQETGENTSDLSLNFAHSGNGVSVDSSAMDAGLANVFSKFIPQISTPEALRDLHFYQNSKIPLGMLYKGQQVVALQVKSACPNGNKDILVYASMSNLSFLRQYPELFRITGTVDVNEDLRPWLKERFGVNLSKLQSRNEDAFSRMRFTSEEPLHSSQLFVIDSNYERIWGWDYRNLLFIDFEDLEFNKTKTYCEIISEEWARGFGKGFGIQVKSRNIIASLREYIKTK